VALNDAYPASLSQGECSRLSVARAVAARPQVLVLDEPLEHVDTALWDQCWQVLRDEIQATGASLVFSTHSPERVLSEAEWCLCLDTGRLVWAGPVEELYERPASPELARFLGPCNWVEEGPRAEGLGPRASDRQQYLTNDQGPGTNDDFESGRANGPVPRPVRPERLQLVTDDSGPFEVIAERFSGSLAEVEITQVATGITQRVYHRPPRPTLKPGQRVSLRILATILAVLTCLWQSGCDVLGVPELKVLASESVRIPVDGKRMPAPRALTISPEKELYCLDDSGRILVYSPENELVRQWRMPESDVGKPEGIRILQDGRVAIADTHYHRVVFFNKQGDLLGMFGSKGEKPGEFTYPVDLLQDPQGFLYVAEYGGSDRIQKFAPDGQFVLEFGGLGTEVGKFQRPSGMVWIDSKIYVADAINSRVQVFSDLGEPLEVLDWARQGGLYYPYDISLNPQGQIFMVEYGACRLTVAEPHGSIIAQYGHEGRGHNELWTPWALTVSEDNRVFIADTGNRRIVQLTLPGGRL
jgi:DNA-binding beta-propeller fold protein YncE